MKQIALPSVPVCLSAPCRGHLVSAGLHLSPPASEPEEDDQDRELFSTTVTNCRS